MQSVRLSFRGAGVRCAKFPTYTPTQCYVQLLLGFLLSMVTGMMRCQEWVKNCRTHIEFIQRNHGLRGFWGANSVLRQRSHVKWIIGQFFVQDGNLAVFMQEVFMCNLVGSQVSKHVFHSSWRTAALSHEQVFVQFCSEPWWLNSIFFPCPLRTVAVLLTRTGCSDWERAPTTYGHTRPLCWYLRSPYAKQEMARSPPYCHTRVLSVWNYITMNCAMVFQSSARFNTSKPPTRIMWRATLDIPRLSCGRIRILYGIVTHTPWLTTATRGCWEIASHITSRCLSVHEYWQKFCPT